MTQRAQGVGERQYIAPRGLGFRVQGFGSPINVNLFWLCGDQIRIRVNNNEKLYSNSPLVF